MIISLNGLDDCGKTTQIKNITKKYGDTWSHIVLLNYREKLSV